MGGHLWEALGAEWNLAFSHGTGHHGSHRRHFTSFDELLRGWGEVVSEADRRGWALIGLLRLAFEGEGQIRFSPFGGMPFMAR
jgi:hypothetical protein